MQLQASDISIIIPTYKRLHYLFDAIDSALKQTIPVPVYVIDDEQNNPNTRNMLQERYGDRVSYHCNERNLRLFRNLNECLVRATTPWISILHDDDMLLPDFLEHVLEVAPEIDENCRLIFGGTIFIDEQCKVSHVLNEQAGRRWQKTPLEVFAERPLFGFPGQLINVEAGRRLGGFPTGSAYTGDWDLWFRLALDGCAIHLGVPLAYYRQHSSVGHCTSDVTSSGRREGYLAMQAKRNYSRLRKHGYPNAKYNRVSAQGNQHPLFHELISNSWHMTARKLRYNRHLLLLSPPHNTKMRTLHTYSRYTGNLGMRLLSISCVSAGNLGLRAFKPFRRTWSFLFPFLARFRG